MNTVAEEALVHPGDRVAFLDFDGGIERTGIVTAYLEDATATGAGFPGFVVLDPVTEGHRWGYLSQIVEINGVATTF